MSHTTNHDVGRAFAECREAVGGGGNWRTALTRAGVCIGVSYRTPVCATDGTTVLRTIETYSVTTSGKHLSTIHHARGEWLPVTEKMLFDLAAGSITFAHAVELARDLLKFASVRLTAKGLPMEPYEDGYIPRYSYRTEDAFAYRKGSKWMLRVNELHFGPFRTLKELRVKAWTLMGLSGAMASWQDVTRDDVLAVRGLRNTLPTN